MVRSLSHSYWTQTVASTNFYSQHLWYRVSDLAMWSHTMPELATLICIAISITLSFLLLQTGAIVFQPPSTCTTGNVDSE